MSSAGAEWVSAPTEMRSTPVAAIVGDGLQRHSTRGFQQRPAGGQGDRLAQRRNVHVVEQHDVGAGLERLRQLVERRHFDLDAQGVRRPLPRQRDGARDAIRHRRPPPGGCP